MPDIYARFPRTWRHRIPEHLPVHRIGEDGRKNWKEAEAPLHQSIALDDQEINHWEHSSSDFMKANLVPRLRLSKDEALTSLATTLHNEGRDEDALKLLERAYAEATKFNAPAFPTIIIIVDGIKFSTAAHDKAAMAEWSKRGQSIRFGQARPKSQ